MPATDIHPLHREHRRAVVRDLAALIVAEHRRNPDGSTPAMLADRLRSIGDGWWMQMAEHTGRFGYVPDPETRDRVAELVEAMAESDRCARILAEAMHEGSALMVDADRLPQMRAKLHERVAEKMMVRIGEAYEAITRPVEMPAVKRSA